MSESSTRKNSPYQGTTHSTMAENATDASTVPRKPRAPANAPGATGGLSHTPQQHTHGSGEQLVAPASSDPMAQAEVNKEVSDPNQNHPAVIVQPAAPAQDAPQETTRPVTRTAARRLAANTSQGVPKPSSSNTSDPVDAGNTKPIKSKASKASSGSSKAPQQQTPGSGDQSAAAAGSVPNPAARGQGDAKDTANSEPEPKQGAPRVTRSSVKKSDSAGNSDTTPTNPKAPKAEGSSRPPKEAAHDKTAVPAGSGPAAPVTVKQETEDTKLPSLPTEEPTRGASQETKRRGGSSAKGKTSEATEPSSKPSDQAEKIVNKPTKSTATKAPKEKQAARDDTLAIPTDSAPVVVKQETGDTKPPPLATARPKRGVSQETKQPSDSTVKDKTSKEVPEPSSNTNDPAGSSNIKPEGTGRVLRDRHVPVPPVQKGGKVKQDPVDHDLHALRDTSYERAPAQDQTEGYTGSISAWYKGEFYQDARELKRSRDELSSISARPSGLPRAGETGGEADENNQTDWLDDEELNDVIVGIDSVQRLQHLPKYKGYSFIVTRLSSMNQQVVDGMGLVPVKAISPEKFMTCIASLNHSMISPALQTWNRNSLEQGIKETDDHWLGNNETRRRLYIDKFFSASSSFTKASVTRQILTSVELRLTDHKRHIPFNNKDIKCLTMVSGLTDYFSVFMEKGTDADYKRLTNAKTIPSWVALKALLQNVDASFLILEAKADALVPHLPQTHAEAMVVLAQYEKPTLNFCLSNGKQWIFGVMKRDADNYSAWQSPPLTLDENGGNKVTLEQLFKIFVLWATMSADSIQGVYEALPRV